MTERTTFQRRIRRFAAVRRRLVNAALAYRLAGMALAAGVASLVFLSGWLPNGFLNLGLFGALAVFLLALAVRFIVRRVTFRGWVGEAFIMEELAGGLNSRLVSAWDFLSREMLSPLMQAVVKRAEADLAFTFEEQLDRRERNRRRRRFALLLVAFIALGLTPWFGFSKVVANFHRSLAEVRDALFPIDYVATPDFGTHVYRLGETVDVELALSRRAYGRIMLISRVGDDPPVAGELPVDERGRAAHQVTSDVEAEHHLQFELGNRTTDEIRLIFTTPPTLASMQTELISPSYTRLLPRTLEGVQQRLLALPGTRMTLGFSFSKELRSATITWDDGETLPLETVGRFASTNLVHWQARRATLQAMGVHGFEMDYPLTIDFDLQTDGKPRLFLPRHLRDDMPLLPEAVSLFGFGVRAEDDYGITRFILQWQRSTLDNPTNVVDQGEIERLISPARRKAVVAFEKIFDGLNLRPGDRLSFTVEVVDNRAPDSQLTRSRRCSLFVYQQDLGGLTINQLGFGAQGGQHGRIAKARRQTMVKSPEGRRTAEQVRNEFEAAVASSARAPAVRGEYSRATQDYFRLLSGVSYEASGKRETRPGTEQPPEGAHPLPPEVQKPPGTGP